MNFELTPEMQQRLDQVHVKEKEVEEKVDHVSKQVAQ